RSWTASAAATPSLPACCMAWPAAGTHSARSTSAWPPAASSTRSPGTSTWCPRRRSRPWSARAATTSGAEPAPDASDDAQGDRLEHRAGAVAGAELVEDGGDVVLHRALGQEQAAGDLLVGIATRQQTQDRHLAWAETLRCGDVVVEAEAFAHRSGADRRQQGAAGSDV